MGQGGVQLLINGLNLSSNHADYSQHFASLGNPI